MFTLTSNISQGLYLENTITDYRVELPDWVMLIANDYKIALASFTYPGMWYNVPNIAGQSHTAMFAFQQGHLHQHRPVSGGSDDDDDNAAATVAATAAGSNGSPPAYPCQGTKFIKRCRTLSARYYENIRQILHDLNGHSGRRQMACQVMITRRMSLLLGRPNQEMVLMGKGNTCLMAPSAPQWDLMQSLCMHCDLAACCAVPVEGQFGHIMCHEPWWLDWLPMRWTKFQHVHMVMTDGHSQKVPFEGRCALWSCW